MNKPLIDVSTEGRRKQIKRRWLVLLVVLAIVGSAGSLGVVTAIKGIADWGAGHQVVINLPPWKFEALGLVEIKERAKEYLVPVVWEKINREALTTIEQKIFDAFGVENYTTMRAIAKCESGMNPESVNWSTRDLGLYQINWPVWEKPIKDKFGYVLSDMFDVDKNIEVAKWIFDRDGDGDGDVNPWVAVNTQCFRDEL
jgi:hypothetical protein